MKNITVIILLLSSIWVPSILDEAHLMESWASVPITMTFITIYLVSFLTLLASLFTEMAEDKNDK